jgi:predicted acylesterase/phospholipase RssA
MSMSECDIIMKGGITSGVVYPKAIVELSENYKFRSIGGTSAGAIAAVLTAAAEYNRGHGGFETVAKIPEELENILESLFQPTPQFRILFNTWKQMFLGPKVSWVRTIAKVVKGSLTPIVGYWPYTLGSLALSVVLARCASGADHPSAVTILAIVAFLFFLAASFVIILILAGLRVRRQNFGLCPGRTQPGNNNKPGLCDWLADKIEAVAGRTVSGPHKIPLTFSDVWYVGTDGKTDPHKKTVDLQMMTTNLTLRRPNTLPYLEGNHYFRESEFRAIFPDWVIDYLVQAGYAAEEAHKKDPEHKEEVAIAMKAAGYIRFPSGGALPLVVAARMSLSFPLLFSTVPLYRVEYPSMKDLTKPPVTRMLFSDGGLSSNFPVHFFDALLPTRPTFGISLENTKPSHPDWRVHLPFDPSDGLWLDGRKIDSLKGFLTGLVDAAKDWQDRLQSTLPGYRERIVSVYLKEDEGGINLTMPKKTIDALTEFGARAGGLMTNKPDPRDKVPFDFNDHRWRRFLVAYACLEETLEHANLTWGNPADSFSKFIDDYKKSPRSYRGSAIDWRDEVFRRFSALMTLASTWNPPLRDERSGKNVPKPRTNMRITPRLEPVESSQMEDHGSSSVSQ